MIKNLPRQLNEAGKIKIGKKGAMITSTNGNEFRPPKKLDHFQLVTTEKNQDGDYIVDVSLQNKIKESGSGLVNENGALIGLPIRLLYNDTELNFPHRYVSYVSGKMSCHGDGEESRKRVDNFKAIHPCPCNRVESGYDGKDKCKISGSLTCIIDEAGLFGQAHIFRTTSMNTVKGILGGIELIKAATGGRIAGLPLMLTMNAKQTSTPQGIATTVYIVSICYRGSMTDLRNEVLQIMSTEKQYLLSMDTIEAEAKQSVGLETVDADEEREFVEEFFPDAAVVTGEVVNEKVDQAKEVIAADSKVVQDPDTNSEDQAGSYDQVKDNETYKNILEPVGSYKAIYDNFIAEKNLDAAMKFANRLQKGNLLYWLVNNYSDIEFEPNIKKPEALELIKNILESTLVSDDTTTTGQTESVESVVPGSVAGTEMEKETEPAEEYPSKWDDSGKIEKDQLRELVRLKTFLESEGVLLPNKWVDHVKYFTDKDGIPIEKAVNLTYAQGETFILMLGNSVPVAA